MAILDFTRYATPDLKYSAALVAPNAHGHYEPAGVYRIRKDGAGTVAWTITYAAITPIGEAVEERVAGHRTLDGAKRVAVLDAERRITEARNVPQNATQPPEPVVPWGTLPVSEEVLRDAALGYPSRAQEPVVLARLSSTITVEDGRHGIEIWSSGRVDEKCIILRREAEEKLLALLLARKGIGVVHPAQ